MHKTPVLLKIIHFTFFSTDLFVCFFSKKHFYLKKCLCLFMLPHGVYLNGTSNLFVYLLIIFFLGHDWFGFFLSK